MSNDSPLHETFTKVFNVMANLDDIWNTHENAVDSLSAEDQQKIAADLQKSRQSQGSVFEELQRLQEALVSMEKTLGY